jgi:hypothetical protein
MVYTFSKDDKIKQYLSTNCTLYLPFALKTVSKNAEKITPLEHNFFTFAPP